MNTDRDRSASELFADALELPAEKRGGFLDEACGDDTKLRQEVESLLDVYPRAQDFFARKLGNSAENDSATEPSNTDECVPGRDT